MKNIQRNGLLHENDLLSDSFGGKTNPKAALFLLKSLPVITRALLRGKATPKVALLHPHKAPKDVKRIFETVEGRDERYELNLYITGYDEDDSGAGEPNVAAIVGGGEDGQSMASAPGASPKGTI